MSDRKAVYNEFVSMFDIDGELKKQNKSERTVEDSFEDLSKIVSEDIAGEDMEGGLDKAAEERFRIAAVVEDVVEEDESLDDFDGIDVDEKEEYTKKKDEDIIKSVQESKKETKVDFDVEPEVKKEPEVVPEVKQEKRSRELIIEDGEVQWILESPSRLYDTFYSDKKEVISSITDGFHIPFGNWTGELIDCRVEINTEVFDNKTYINQMYLIQNFLDRVKNIQIKVNNQFFLCHEFLPKLKGCLARVEYLKPALKQDGLDYEHLKDLMWYHSKLEHLHESSKNVVRTLEKAWETVSRKASLTTPTRSAEKYTIGAEEEQEVKQEVKQELEEYDDLPEEAEVVYEKKKMDFCDWGEIGKK